MNDWSTNNGFTNDGPTNDRKSPEDEPPKSKTQIKKDMHALQVLGEKLTQLNQEQLACLPLPDNLRTAIAQAQGMKREALRRQLQYIGKLMRKTETDDIQAAFAELQEKQNRNARAFHRVERWRDHLIQGDETTITHFINEYPAVDRQQLRHLVHGAKREASQQKPPAQARKLFKWILAVVSDQ